MTNEHTEDQVEETKQSITVSLKTITTIITGAVTILGAIWALDNHYASAADVAKLQQSVETQFNQLRTERTEDELLKLDAKKQVQGGKLDPIDSAMYERYTRRLQQTQQDQRLSDRGIK